MFYIHLTQSLLTFLLQGELRQKAYTADTVGEYRIVWLRLSQLASNLGKFSEQWTQPGYHLQIKGVNM
jgi:hypothetical protein